MQIYSLSKTYRGGLYLRLSKEGKNFVVNGQMQSNSIENQKEYIKEFLKSRPEIVPVECYIDDGYSGVNFDRPSFQRMLQDILDNKIDCVIVKDLSRLGRNYIEVGKYVEKLFPLLGVRFIAINDNYDSADENAAVNGIIVPFKNLINDAYCRDISIKIRSHLEIKRKRGEFIGAFPVYGYARGENKNKLIVDPYASGIVKEIFQMKLDGMSQQHIADELNSLGIISPAEYKKEIGSGYRAVFQTHSKAKWTAMAVLRILTNEVYVGTLIQGRESTPNYKVKIRQKKPQAEWTRVENVHEAIIKKADFEVVQEILQKDTRVTEKGKTVSLYSGYLTCADCGCSMVRQKVSGYVYYVCSGNKKDKNICSSHRISEIELNDALGKTIRLHLRYLADLQMDVCAVRESSYRSDKENMISIQIIKKKEEIEKYSHLKLECYEDLKNGMITQDEFILFKQELEKRIMEAEQSIEELARRNIILANNKLEKLTWLDEFIKNPDEEIKRSVLVRFVNRIYIYENHRVEILFRYQDEMEKIAKIIEEMKLKSDFEEVV